MAFCKLPDGQKAALMFLKAIEAAPPTYYNLGRYQELVKKQQKWQALAFLASMMPSFEGAEAPTEEDLAAVGSLPEGVQNAHFLLAIMDIQATDDAKAKAQEAMGRPSFHLVAEAISDSMGGNPAGIQVAASDLVVAYELNDNEAAASKSDVQAVISGLIASGALVGNLSSKSMRDFYENDFSNLFTGTIPDFFKGDFEDFFKGLARSLEEGYEGFEEYIRDYLEDIGQGPRPGPVPDPDPSKW